MTFRREFLKRSILSVLALRLWLPWAVAADESADGSFNFIVVNDTHYQDAACARYFEAAFSQMKAGPKFDFMLVVGDISTSGERSEFKGFKDVADRCLPVPVYCVMGNHDAVHVRGHRCPDPGDLARGGVDERRPALGPAAPEIEGGRGNGARRPHSTQASRSITHAACSLTRIAPTGQ